MVTTRYIQIYTTQISPNNATKVARAVRIVANHGSTTVTLVQAKQIKRQHFLQFGKKTAKPDSCPFHTPRRRSCSLQSGRGTCSIPHYFDIREAILRKKKRKKKILLKSLHKMETPPRPPFMKSLFIFSVHFLSEKNR